ncbi:MAG: cytochrome b subunit [Candidatus Tokpelaia sp. JSC085]|nr:MAG: cytochrome b subunit [Candidatus Tokpelaia sp. JSC085]
MKNSTAISKRPLAPHVSIYRWPITMMGSIAHRISGGALYCGTLFLAIWLVSIAYSQEIFCVVNAFYSSVFGRIILFTYTFALVYHLVSGVRYLFWDIRTTLLEIHYATKMIRVTVFISIILTLFIWVVAYMLL